MSYYNESLFDVGNTFYDMSYATNQVSGGLYASFLILGCLFVITFAILKFRQNSNNVSLLYSGVLTTFISILLFWQGMVTEYVVSLCLVSTAGFLIMYKVTEE